MNKKIPIELINSLNEILKESINLIADESYLNDLLSGTDVLKRMLEINGVDTVEREMFKDLLAKKLVQMEWPCFMDSEDKVDCFLNKFAGAVEKEKSLHWVD